MRRLFAILSGLGLGAGLMYILDPDRGHGRRAVIRDKTTSKLRHTSRLLQSATHRIANRTKGVLADVRAELDFSPLPDVILEERVRAALGHAVPHAVAHAIDVSSQMGVVTLSGQAHVSQLKHLTTAAEQVHGVLSVVNRLELVPDDAVALVAGPAGGVCSQCETVTSARWPMALVLLGVAGGALMYYSRNHAPETEEHIPSNGYGEAVDDVPEALVRAA